MKILWITNIMLPPICKAMQMPVPAIGGWMYSSLKRLNIYNPKIDMAVATVYPGKELIIKDIDGVRYYLLPLRGRSTITYNQHLESFWQIVKEDFQPDVVHIHGSEYPHGLAYVRACSPEGVVISLQGIISSIARYYAAGIDYTDVKKCLTFRDFLKNDSILKGLRSFERRGKLEIELLQRVNHIIGRTAWDKSHAWAINPAAYYHHCGETLRNEFYRHKWSYSGCEPYSMFVSQAGYPIKGLHMLIKAMPLILREYPQAKIYVAGTNPTDKPFWRITGYGKYLKKLINRYELGDAITFTGTLDEAAMCQQYLRCNVFVCCSAIENSPNSLGEAQLMGVPHVASYVGGVPQIVNENPEVLYRFEEYEMLAKKICKLFSLKGEVEAPWFDASMYDGETNTAQLIEAYNLIRSHASYDLSKF